MRATFSIAPVTVGYWQLKEDSTSYAPYKNDILKKWQDALRERGISDVWQLKIFTAQAMAENGALSPDVIGDSGCSLGLPQRNFCSHAGITAKTALKKWPEWKGIDFQLSWFSKAVKSNLDRYSDIEWAVTTHNCPSCAQKHYNNGYWDKVVTMSKSLELTY